MNYYEFLPIIFPTAKNSSDICDLFVRVSSGNGIINNNFCSLTKYSFDTWMNTFPAKKYYFYCEIGNVFLNLDIEGQYQVNVFGSTRNLAFGVENTLLLDEYCDGKRVLKLHNVSAFDGVFFVIYENNKKPISIKKISWCTDNEPQRSNNLAVITCTYKRETYVYKNIEIFKSFIEHNIFLSKKIRYLFVDNGNTLNVGNNIHNISIISNKNAGGAGGFARGLIEVMENCPDVTRVIFMDDDVEIIPESFYKVLLLSNFLKEAYKNSFINGSMLDLYNKNMFYENMGIRDRLWVRPIFSNIPLNDYSSVLFINDINPEIFNQPNAKIHNAWYFHCFSMATAKSYGLPVPYFIRGDDVEWSWRNYGKHHISINGICVWHSPFIWRVSQTSDYYYLPRNMFYNNILYIPSFKDEYKKFFSDIFKYLIRTYNYHGIDIFFYAINDILKGSVVFKEDPVEQLKAINKINKKDNYYTASEDEVHRALNYKRHVHKWQRFLYKISHYGNRLPKIFYKGTGYALDANPPIKNFILLKQVKVINPLTRQCEVRKIKLKKVKEYNRQFLLLMQKLENNYDRLAKDYKEAHTELTSIEFWKDYLCLSKR